MAEGKHTTEQLLRRFGREDSGAAEKDEMSSGPNREHQTNAQAFALSVVFKDQRRKQTFPWSMYGGHEWTDDGDMEVLSALFGSRILILRGFRFEELDRDMNLGKRAAIRQHTSRQVELMRREDGTEPIIAEIEAYPPFSEIVTQVKGESDDETGHAGNAKRR